jgi:hypothetical protein
MQISKAVVKNCLQNHKYIGYRNCEKSVFWGCSPGTHSDKEGATMLFLTGKIHLILKYSHMNGVQEPYYEAYMNIR